MLQDCRKNIGILAAGTRKMTQIRNNQFYPEVRKYRLYELILLSSIILTQILIWGALCWKMSAYLLLFKVHPQGRN